MTSMKRKYIGVIWLFVMYLVMVGLFFWNFYLALSLFSVTWGLCFLFRKYLPEMPYPAVDKETLCPRRYSSIPYYLAFTAPALLLALAYHIGLQIDPEYIRNEWPVEKLVPVTGAELFNYKWLLDEWGGDEEDLSSVYLLIKLLNIFSFSFVFFLSHWFLGARPFLRKMEFGLTNYSVKKQSWWLRNISAFVVMYCAAFIVMYLGLGGESSGGGYSDMVNYFYNNKLLSSGAVIVVTWPFYVGVWVLVNNIMFHAFLIFNRKKRK